jgi:phosphoglycolate phosphatase-like HAD superfamily hydrolase
MLTETEVARGPEVPENIEEVEYPPEVVARWDSEIETVRTRIATGQAKIYGNVKDLFRDLKKK